MKLNKISAALLVALIAGALAAPGAAVAKKAKKPGPVVIGTDDAGDWGCNVDCSLAPLGDGSGQDLLEASIEMADKKTVNFVITVNSLPPSGGVPEFVRYTWDFVVDGEAFQMSGGFTEYLRGVCNPNTTNTCPPPRDPGQAPFFLRQGPCNVGAACIEVALLHGIFDAATGTITVPIPADVIGAKPGAEIAPGGTSLGGTVYAAPGAFVTYASLPNDILTATETFVVPGKAKK